VASLGCGSVRLRYTPIERSHHGSLWVGGGRRGRVLRRSILGTAASQSARAVRQADATSKRGHHASPRAGRAMAGPRPRSPAPAHADGRADRHRCPQTGSTSPPVSMPRLLATLRTDAVDVLGLPEKPFTSYCSRTTPGPSPYTFWSCAMFWSDIPIALPAISLRGENLGKIPELLHIVLSSARQMRQLLVWYGLVGDLTWEFRREGPSRFVFLSYHGMMASSLLGVAPYSYAGAEAFGMLGCHRSLPIALAMRFTPSVNWSSRF